MMKTNIIEIINQFPDQRIEKFKPLAVKSIKAFESRFQFRFPKDYFNLMKYSDGISLYGEYYNLILGDLRSLKRYNMDEWFKEALPNMFIIGDDGAEALYFYDKENYFKVDTNAVFMVTKDALYLDDAVFIGKTLTEVIIRIFNNENLQSAYK